MSVWVNQFAIDCAEGSKSRANTIGDHGGQRREDPTEQHSAPLVAPLPTITVRSGHHPSKRRATRLRLARSVLFWIPRHQSRRSHRTPSVGARRPRSTPPGTTEQLSTCRYWDTA